MWLPRLALALAALILAVLAPQQDGSAGIMKSGGAPSLVGWSHLACPIVADGVTDNTTCLNSICSEVGCNGSVTVYCDTGTGNTVLYTGQWNWSSGEWIDGKGCPVEPTLNSTTNAAFLTQAVLTSPIVNAHVDNLNLQMPLITFTGTITGGTTLTISGLSGNLQAGMLIQDGNNPRNVLRNTTIVSGGPTVFTITAPSGTQGNVGPETMQAYAPNRTFYLWADGFRAKGWTLANYSQGGIMRGANVWLDSWTGTTCYQYTGHPGIRYITNGVGSTVPAVPPGPDLLNYGTVDTVQPNVLVTGFNLCGGDGVIQLCSPGLTTDPTWGGEQDCKQMVAVDDTVSTISGVAALVGTGSAAGPFLSTISQIVYKNLNGTAGTTALSIISSSGVAIDGVTIDGGTIDASSDTTGTPSVIVEATVGCSGCSTSNVTVENGTINNPLLIDARADTGATNTIFSHETFNAPRTSTGTNLITRGDTDTTVTNSTMVAASDGNCVVAGSNGYLSTGLTLTGNGCTGITNTNVAYVINNVTDGTISLNVGAPAAAQTNAKGLTTASAASPNPGTTSTAIDSNDM